MGLFRKTPTGGEHSPMELPIMSLREVVMFPHAIMPLFVGREASVKAIESSIADYGKQIFLVAQKEPDVEKPGPDDLFPVGVVSKILQLLRLPDGSIKVLFEGMYRAAWRPYSAHSAFGDGPFPLLQVTRLDEAGSSNPEQEALIRATHEAVEDFGRVNKKMNQEHLAAIAGLREPGRLADAVMPHLKLDHLRKQEVLETLDTGARLEKVFELLSGELAVASLEKTIKSRVKTQMERNQREYYLNEQIKAIHKEMGHEDDPQAEAAELEQRFRAKNMPEEARERGLREVRKLRQMPPSSAEYSVARNYIDWILDLPWNELKEIDVDIQLEPCWTALTTVWKSPRSASSNIWPCRSWPDASRGPSSAWWGLPAWARPRWPNPWPRPRAANSCAFPWAACGTRRKSGGTAAPMWARCPARYSWPSSGQNSTTPCSAWMKSIK